MFSKKKQYKEPNENVVGEALKVQDVLSKFKYNINPSFIYASVEKKTASELKKARTVEIMWAVFVVVILIGGAIAYVLISNQSTLAGCQQDLKTCIARGGGVASGTQAAAQAAQQQTPFPATQGGASTTIS
jgi:ubiquitin